jgi:hypothetical protein
VIHKFGNIVILMFQVASPDHERGTP